MCIIRLLRTSLFWVIAIAVTTVASGCKGNANRNSASEHPQPEAKQSITNKPLENFQADLLDVAFETATSIPIHPHIKTRSKVQESVVKACLDLDQPLRALDYLQRIDNWRRGVCYADLALYLAKQGHEDEVQKYLDLANLVAEEGINGVTDLQEWRSDHIRVKIAQTHAWLGQMQGALRFETNVEPFEQGKVASIAAMKATTDSFEVQMKSLEELTSMGNFDITNNALRAYVQLFNRFYDNEDYRTRVEDKIKSFLNKLPVFLRIELLEELAGYALEHSDSAKALELMNESGHMIENQQWPAEYQIPLISRVSKVRFRAGDQERARADLEGALAQYDRQYHDIVNIDRADVLRQVAQAYHTMGDRENSLLIYKRAIEAGMDNPNSRPRAEDLAATCLSLALNSVEPDSELWARIREIQGGLGHPW